MSKTIIISHGDKGGCGKSHVAMVVGSELAKTNTPMLIIDADAIENGDGGDGDVAGRFGSYAQSSVQSISTRLTGEQGDSERRVGQMLDLIEESDASIVLVNLPANASQTLEEQGELLAEMVQEFGHHLYVLYSFEPMAASVAGAVASANGAIMQAAARVVLIRNEHFGSVAEYDALINANPPIASLYRVTIPVLGERGIKALKDYPRADLTALAESPDLRWTLRKTLSGYQRRTARALFDALGLHIIESQSDEVRPSIDEVF